MVALPRCAAPHTPIRHDLGMSSAHPDPDAVMHTSTSDTPLQVHAIVVVAGINRIRRMAAGRETLAKANEFSEKFPPGGVSWRGGGFRNEFRSFYVPGLCVCVCVCVCVCLSLLDKNNHVCSRSFITHS